MPSVSEDVQSICYYSPSPILLHGYVGPFIIVYLLEVYVWLAAYGLDEYFEAGCIAIAGTAVVQVVTCLFCVWSVHVRCLLTCKKASSVEGASLVKVTPTANNGFTELVTLHKDKEIGSGKLIIWFVFQKVKYYYDYDEKKQFNVIDFPVQESYQYYSKWTGYHSDQQVKINAKKYGANRLDISPPDFLTLFTERATAPFFVFQVFCVLLWCLDEYWYYSIFTLVMLILFEVLLVKQQQRNLTQIRKMGSKPYKVQVYRENKWKYIISDELLPGDLVSVGRSKEENLVPCDLLLLRGSCIVDEAMLTGESVPQMKEPLENVVDVSQVLDIHDNSKKLHIISGGTKVVQHTSPAKSSAGIKAPDGGCVCYVLRTGFNTSQGKLLRTILFSVKRASANNLEAFIFILFLLIFAIAASSYVWIKGTEDPNRNRYKLFLECTLILTSVVPPELPIELSLAVNASLVTLAKIGIFCTEPFRIPFAGKVDICCFDKTGTLTSDNLIVEGIAGLDNQKGEGLLAVDQAPLETQQVLGCCHSLLMLDDELVGDPLEKASLTALNWELTKNDCVHSRKGKKHSLKILQRFHFSSALKRMSTVCNLLGGAAQHIAVVKGAAEVIRPMLKNVPDYYDELHCRLSRQGARVLALGYRKLGNLSPRELHELRRTDVECDMEFVGFVVFSCPLKADSRMNIKKLLAASHHVMMITGDNPLTACHVAKELKIVTKQTVVLTNQSNTWCWQSVDETVKEPVGVSNIRELANQFDLCITGEGMIYLTSLDNITFKTILPHVKVFARVSPKQKEHVVVSLRNLGYHTLMCGDGTNDVGALKHAHVGMALLSSSVIAELDKRKELNEKKAALLSTPGLTRRPLHQSQNKAAATAAELKQQQMKQLMKELDEAANLDQPKVVKLGDASIASPFTSRHSSIECICHVIRQGRCTLVTTLQMFKILAINALIIAYSQSVLYLEGIKFSDTQATIQGILLATCFLFISHSKPLEKLSKERPLSNIFNVYTIVTVVMQFLVHFSCLIYLVREAAKLSPPREEEFVDLEKKFEQTVLNSTVYLISMTMQISNVAVNYRGHPFMASLRENRLLCYSLLAAVTMVFLLASGLMPELSEYLEVVEFPSEFQTRLVIVLATDLMTSYVVDQVLLRLCGNAKLRRP